MSATHYLIRRHRPEGDHWLTDHGSWSPNRWQAARVVRRDDAAFSARAQGAVLVTVRAYGVRAGERRAELLARIGELEEALLTERAENERLRRPLVTTTYEPVVGEYGFTVRTAAELDEERRAALALVGAVDDPTGVGGPSGASEGILVALAAGSEATRWPLGGPLVYAAPDGLVTLAEEERAVGTLSGTWPADRCAIHEAAHRQCPGSGCACGCVEAEEEGATAPGGGER